MAMGDVLRFRPRDGVRQQSINEESKEGDVVQTAQILLFTGVRYERYGEVDVESIKPHKKRGRPRKRA